MSTRAIYTFRDNQDEYHVYKHSDGYPRGACDAICNALDFAWDLPRFEADEFAAGFIAGNKTGWAAFKKRYSDANYTPSRSFCGGELRLLHSGKWQDVAPGDIEYRYEIFQMDSKIHVKAFSVDSGDWNAPEIVWTETPIFTGTLTEFKKHVKKAQAA